MITLNTPIMQLNRVGTTVAQRLKKLGLETVYDLLVFFPYRYDDFREITPIDKLKAGQTANIVGRIELIQNKRSPRKRMYITEGLISDGTEQIKVIWFNQPFIAKNLKTGDRISLTGKIEGEYGDEIIKSPAYEKIITGQTIHTQGIIPNYHLTSNITQKQIRFLIKQILPLAEKLDDWLPEEIIKKNNFFSLGKAIETVHFPKNFNDLDKAKKRLAFNELFLLQLNSQLIKSEIKNKRAFQVKFKEKETKKFVATLPFSLTNAQKKAAWSILKDMEKARPMSRLIEGDVGSGKTIVAIIAMLNAALNGLQSALMVPTEILAKQHFETFCKILKPKLPICLLTRSQFLITNYQFPNDEKISKNLIIKNIKNNSFKIIIGTHALIQEKIEFDNLALAIIDEQHRFGVEQRKALIQTKTDFTQTNADSIKIDTANKLLYKDLTYKIRGVIFTVKKNLGLGHKEKIYQKALEAEFIKANIFFEKEKTININYDNKIIGVYRPDFVIENKIILEIKVLPFIGKYEKQQVWHYLKGSDYQLALLANFSRNDVEIERFIYSQNKNPIRKSPQKSAKVRKSPHLLSLTATPIPRSLALALYGDLDLSIIDEMPAGRKKILTKVVPENKRPDAYNFIREKIREGRQVFVICPLIDFSDKLGVKSVKAEYAKLNKKIFPDIEIGMLHGKMKAKDKEAAMRDFLDKKTKILVSTSVVEVGVDVPNASIMMIEGAERFGLAQLHQFRGRVGRGQHQSYCFLFSEGEEEKSLSRLRAMEDTSDGFALAKTDLKFRGPGEVYGTSQKGFPKLKIATLFDYELMKTARDEAEKMLNKDKRLSEYPKIKEKLAQLNQTAHLE